MALGTTLIPILSEIENKKGITEKNKYLNNILNIVSIGLIILAVFGVVVYYVYNFYSRVFYGTTILNNIY